MVRPPVLAPTPHRRFSSTISSVTQTTLTWQRGRHLFKFGGEFLRYQQNSFYPGNDGELGAFAYNGQYSKTSYVPAGSNLSNVHTYPPSADFVLERADDVQIGAVTGRTGQRQWRDGIYAQDDWKIRPNLTINLGLRWEFDQVPSTKSTTVNRQTWTSADQLRSSMPASNGASRALYDPIFTPSSSAAHSACGFRVSDHARLLSSAVATGISSYLEGTGAEPSPHPEPATSITDFEQSRASAPAATWAEHIYSRRPITRPPNGFPTTAAPTTTFYAWPNAILKPAVTQEFSLTNRISNRQRTPPSRSVMLASSFSTFTDPFWGNQDSPLLAFRCSLRQHRWTGRRAQIINKTESNSNYNALQAVFRQRLTNGFELTANYTYSKSLTDDIGFYGVSNIGSGQYYQQNIAI